MILGKVYTTPSEEGHLEKAITILREKYGLVDATLDPLVNNQGVLVWEDKEGIGRYRVHFKPNLHEGLDFIGFRYWCNSDRLSRKILEQDPMKASLDEVYSLAVNPKDLHWLCGEDTIDGALRKVE
jgi:hypothetical protein